MCTVPQFLLSVCVTLTGSLAEAAVSMTAFSSYKLFFCFFLFLPFRYIFILYQNDGLVIA